MSTYLISDIHGDGRRWEEMKEKIRFSPTDKIIVLGDVIDRGPDGIKILKEIIDTPNIKMLMGNHEWMMLNCIANPSSKPLMDNWVVDNGGYPTYQAMCALSENEQNSIVNWLLKNARSGAYTKAPDGRLFSLVHGWPYDSDDVIDEVTKRVWGRPERCDVPKIKEGSILVIGHTPTQHFYTDDEWVESRRSHNKILHAPHFIDIDCGCGHRDPHVCLGCLRIDDMAEFYVH